MAGAPVTHEPSEWRIRPTRTRDGVVIERYDPADLTTLRLRVVMRRETGLSVGPRDDVVSVPLTVLEWALAELAALTPG